VHEGYNVVTACNGKQALETYKSHSEKIDLVLMDIVMPVMSGLDAHSELKQFDPCLPIVLMSAYPADSFDNVSNKHFIRKPMIPQELFKYIEVALDESTSCNEP
jgi:CheY-like chemotaxis protein